MIFADAGSGPAAHQSVAKAVVEDAIDNKIAANVRAKILRIEPSSMVFVELADAFPAENSQKTL